MPALSEFPLHVCASRLHPERTYRRAADLYAEPLNTAPKHVLPILMLEEEQLAVYRGTPPNRDDVCAVYIAEGTIAVPTGRIFVRFHEGSNARAHAATLRQLGYVIEDVPDYAPHVAWVRSTNGNIALALRNLDALCRLPEVENIEPQFITARAKR